MNGTINRLTASGAHPRPFEGRMVRGPIRRLAGLGERALRPLRFRSTAGVPFLPAMILRQE